jgi:hemerythrin
MLGEIHAGIAAHFALEERLMRAAGYAEYAAHKDDHERLLEQILDLMDVYAADPEQGSRLLSEQLSDWFSRHFASFDARMHGKLVQPADHSS